VDTWLSKAHFCVLPTTFSAFGTSKVIEAFADALAKENCDSQTAGLSGTCN
jgi:hypothetical protein